MEDIAGKLTSALLSAVYALCLFPDVQVTAQDEIDTLVGNSRSPSWEDLDEGRLPYISALAKEILRWRPVMALTCASPFLRDTMHRGFLIPKAAQIMCNIWAIHRNAQEFPEPDIVRPERFLEHNEDGLASQHSNGTGHNAFGWGLQLCSGQALAEQSLLCVLARLLWAFNIEPGIDEPVSVRFCFSLPPQLEADLYRMEPVRSAFSGPVVTDPSEKDLHRDACRL